MPVPGLLLKIIQMFNTGDTSDADQVFSAEYADHQQPAGLNLTGPEEFRAIVNLARHAMPSLSVTIRDASMAAGTHHDTATARLLWESQAGTRETIEILNIRNGLVTQHWGMEIHETDARREKMNQEIKERWVADLRSGQYKQGKGVLRTPDIALGERKDGKPRFCCLGVLCEQAAAAGIIRWTGTGYQDAEGTRNQVLPEAVIRWAGLGGNISPDNPAVTDRGTTNTLGGINDGSVYHTMPGTGPRKFSTIARIIEEQL